MNRQIKKLLAAALALSAAHVQAATTGHTYFSARPTEFDSARKGAAGWTSLVNMDKEDLIGGNLSASFFYAQSHNGEGLGKFFGKENKNKFEIADVSYITHSEATAAVAKETLEMTPEQRVMGLGLSYLHEFDSFCNGLYVALDLPVYQIKRKIDLGNTGTRLKGFFDGSKHVGNGTVAGEKLTKAKITGKDEPATGVGNVEAMVGYTFLMEETYSAGVNAGVTFPTGTEPKGEFVFEPIVGNGRHWGVGAGVDFAARVWGEMDRNLMVNASLNYRYLFEAKETRTVGLGSDAANSGRHYFRASAAGVTVADNTPAISVAANQLTTGVKVTPGSRFDGLLGLCYNHDGFMFDLAYNLFYAEEETLKLEKSDLSVNIVNGATNAAAVKFGGDIGSANGGLKLNADKATATHPAQTTHKVSGGLSYMVKNMDVPLLVGLGGHYEFASEETEALGTWGVTAKVAVSF